MTTDRHPGAAQEHGPGTLRRDCGTPLWSQLGDDLVRRIDAGEFGDVFPGELVLAEDYGVSRQTVRTALRSLREAGIVSAERGRHSKVLAPQIEQPLGGLYSLFASVRAAGMTQRSEVLALVRTQHPPAAAQLDLPATTPLVHLSRVRFADEEPLAVDRVWLPATWATPLLEADFSHTALYTELAHRCGVHPRGGREEIDAVVLTGETARLLAVPVGSPAFAIHRLGCDADQPVEWRETVVRADRFRLRAEFAPHAGYRLAVDAAAPGS